MGQKFKAVIFDVDGVLLDSMGMWTNLPCSYILSMGKEPEEGLNDILMSMSLKEGAEYMIERYSLGVTPKELTDKIGEMIHDFYFNEVEVKPGAAELLKALSDAGIKMTAATASPHDHIERALKRNGLLGYIDGIFTCEDLDTSKSSPDIYFVAAAHLGTKPAETLVFEDSLYALKTASYAGFQTVGVYEEHGEKDQRGMQETADLYIKELSEFRL